jgi:hypothetical protein
MRTLALLVLGIVSCRAPAPRPGGAAALTPDLAGVGDGTSWTVINGERESFVDGDRRALRLAPVGGNRPGSNVAMALVNGLELAAGTIEIDLKGNGREQASFLGVAFAVAGADAYEAVYFRPFNFAADDAEHRGHAVQYIAWPEHTWEKLRAATPGKYEAAIEPVPDPARWFHARVEVTAQTVRVFVDGADKPCLAVDRLGGHGTGKLGLWVDSQQGAFANLKIVPAR